MNIILTLFAVIFVLFLPGFVLSFVFFGERKIDSIERIALSLTLSIATVPFVGFITNLLGVPITILTIIIQIILIFLVAALILIWKKLRK